MEPVRTLELEERYTPSPSSTLTERQKKIAVIKAQVAAKTYGMNTKRIARALIKAFSF